MRKAVIDVQSFILSYLMQKELFPYVGVALFALILKFAAVISYENSIFFTFFLLIFKAILKCNGMEK
ncbi:hypothetical protein PBF_18939 [Cytobacillus firmus DS1]|uniref:Uncharacterized protein n=1 Tax=Cytobacillus firmus DS1 TaxID=1307436 RepID=W7LBW1_CYTFI|nr:hypothetical protein PBF_18939 [Cytobacillus firmus DS1]